MLPLTGPARRAPAVPPPQWATQVLLDGEVVKATVAAAGVEIGVVVSG